MEVRQPGGGKTGVVWGDMHEGGEIHCSVKWSEWPVLRRYVDDQVALVVERRRAVEAWIAKKYREMGMSIFDRN